METETANEKIRFALEAWKTAIQVQQHFNTIEMQIRNISITVLTATIGAAALVYNQAQEAQIEAIKAGTPIPSTNHINFIGLEFSSADVIIFGGLLAWGAFYFMDRWWYHRLLQGAVKQAQYIEDKLEEDIPYADLIALSNAIRKASHYRLFGLIELHSDNRIDLFYLAVAIVLIVIIANVF